MRYLRHASAIVFAFAGFSLGCDQKAKNAEGQAEAHADLAREAFQHSDWRLALDEAQQATYFDEANSRAHNIATASLLALCAGDEGQTSADCRLDLAETHARRALSLEPTDRNARNTLGSVLLLAGGKGLEALEVLRPLTQDPAYASGHLAWANFGWAQLQLGDAGGSVASLRRAVREPRFCVGWYRLGVAYDRWGKSPEAEESVTRALSDKAPECQNLQDAWKFRGELRAKIGKSAEARSDFDRCEKLSPMTASGHSCAASRLQLAAPTGEHP